MICDSPAATPDGLVHENEHNVVIKIPILSGGASAAEEWAFSEDWVSYFDGIVNYGSSDRKRLIVLQSATGLAHTVDQWWLSLTESIRKRRRGAHLPGRRRPALHVPTSLLLECAPAPGGSGHWRDTKREDDVSARTAADTVRLVGLRQ